MRLTTRNIHTYLLDKGFIDIQSLVDGDYSVVQGQTRNLIFRIPRQKAKGLFVKQLHSFDLNNTYILQKDATCLWLIKNNPAFAALSGYVPDYFGFDPERQVLVTEYLPDAVSLEVHVRREGGPSEALLDELAALLASFHFPVSEAVLSSAPVQFFPKCPPWVLNLDAPPVGGQSVMPANNPAMNAVADNPTFRSALTAVRAHWQATSLIHGDIKWMNLLLYPKAGVPALQVIDWEIADIGDPLWDVAGVFQNLLSDALLYANGASGSTAHIVPGIGLADLEAAWPKLGWFWSRYCARLQQRLDDPQAALEKSIRYAGARLVQTATEHNMMTSTLQPNAVKLLQASYALLTGVPDVLARLQPALQPTAL